MVPAENNDFKLEKTMLSLKLIKLLSISTAVKVNFEHILCTSICTMCTLCTLCAHYAHPLCAQCAHENIMCTFFMCTMCP